jgi:hypothetical protein
MSQTWYLNRFAHLPGGTLGKLVRPEGAQTLYTIERPWAHNKPFESCIPDGHYTLDIFHGRRHTNALEVTEVPGRTYILFHPGNHSHDVQGCIAPGINWNITTGGNPEVTQSRIAMDKLMADFDSDPDTFLTITSANCALDT